MNKWRKLIYHYQHVYMQFYYIVIPIGWVFCPWQIWNMKSLGFPDRLGQQSARNGVIISSITRSSLQAPVTVLKSPWLRMQTTKAPLSLWSFFRTSSSRCLISRHVLFSCKPISYPNMVNSSRSESEFHSQKQKINNLVTSFFFQ